MVTMHAAILATDKLVVNQMSIAQVLVSFYTLVLL